jgi:hypothetical protein
MEPEPEKDVITAKPEPIQAPEPPAMGERRARWGYGYQDKVATAQVLDLLRVEIRDGTRHFEGVRLADLQAGRVDDFILVFDTAIQGNSIKWGGAAAPMNWADLVSGVVVPRRWTFHELAKLLHSSMLVTELTDELVKSYERLFRLVETESKLTPKCRMRRSGRLGILRIWKGRYHAPIW